MPAEVDREHRRPDAVVRRRVDVHPHERGDGRAEQDRGAAGLGAQEVAERGREVARPRRPRRERRRRRHSLLLVVLNHVGGPGLGLVRVEAGAAPRAPLAQQVPALVERDLQLLQPLAVAVASRPRRTRAATARAPPRRAARSSRGCSRRPSQPPPVGAGSSALRPRRSTQVSSSHGHQHHQHAAAARGSGRPSPARADRRRARRPAAAAPHVAHTPVAVVISAPKTSTSRPAIALPSSACHPVSLSRSVRSARSGSARARGRARRARTRPPRRSRSGRRRRRAAARPAARRPRRAARRRSGRR